MIKAGTLIMGDFFYAPILGLLLNYFIDLLNSHYAFNNLEIVF